MPNSTTLTVQDILNRLYDAGTNTLFGAVSGGSSTTAVAAATSSDTVIKASEGRLCQVVVTATGTNAMLIYDNASAGSGTVIGALPASPAVGSVYSFNMPAANGITVKGSATNPGVTISWA